MVQLTKKSTCPRLSGLDYYFIKDIRHKTCLNCNTYYQRSLFYSTAQILTECCFFGNFTHSLKNACFKLTIKWVGRLAFFLIVYDKACPLNNINGYGQFWWVDRVIEIQKYCMDGLIHIKSYIFHVYK